MFIECFLHDYCPGSGIYGPHEGALEYVPSTCACCDTIEHKERQFVQLMSKDWTPAQLEEGAFRLLRKKQVEVRKRIDSNRVMSDANDRIERRFKNSRVSQLQSVTILRNHPWLKPDEVLVLGYPEDVGVLWLNEMPTRTRTKGGLFIFADAPVFRYKVRWVGVDERDVV